MFEVNSAMNLKFQFPEFLFHSLGEEDWHNNSIPIYNLGYFDVSPRPNAKKDNLINHEVKPHVLLYNSKCSSLKSHEKIPLFNEIFKDSDCHERFSSIFSQIDDFVSSQVVDVQNCFLIFANNKCGGERGMKHLHPKLQNNGCLVWSFCIPFYKTKFTRTTHGFFHSDQKNEIKKRMYLDYKYIENFPFNYSKIEVDPSQINSFIFNASHVPHYINYTEDLYVWLVYEAVTFKQSDLNTIDMEIIKTPINYK